MFGFQFHPIPTLEHFQTIERIQTAKDFFHFAFEYVFTTCREIDLSSWN